MTSEPEAALLPFGDIYQRYERQVYAYCLSQVRNAGDAEDLAADTFAAAFAAYQRSRPAVDVVRPWLLRIAHNTVIDYYRRRKRKFSLLHRLFHAGADADGSEVSVEREVVMRDQLRFVLERMDHLPGHDRVLIGLRVAGDLSYAEVGAVLGMTEHAATMATRRALERLRRLCEAGQ